MNEYKENEQYWEYIYISTDMYHLNIDSYISYQ